MSNICSTFGRLPSDFVGIPPNIRSLLAGNARVFFVSKLPMVAKNHIGVRLISLFAPKNLRIPNFCSTFAVEMQKQTKGGCIMTSVATHQTLTISFDPSSIYAQTLVQALRLSNLFEVEESPYDMQYVKMVKAAEMGESHRLSRAELWK